MSNDDTAAELAARAWHDAEFGAGSWDNYGVWTIRTDEVHAEYVARARVALAAVRAGEAASACRRCGHEGREHGTMCLRQDCTCPDLTAAQSAGATRPDKPTSDSSRPTQAGHDEGERPADGEVARVLAEFRAVVRTESTGAVLVPVADLRVAAHAMSAHSSTPAVDRESLVELAHSKNVGVYGAYGSGWRDGVMTVVSVLAAQRAEAPGEESAEGGETREVVDPFADQVDEMLIGVSTGAVPYVDLVDALADMVSDHRNGVRLRRPAWLGPRP